LAVSSRQSAVASWQKGGRAERSGQSAETTEFIFFDVGLKMLSPYLKKNVSLCYKYLEGFYSGYTGLNLKNVGAQHFEPIFFKFNLDEYLIEGDTVSKVARKIFIIPLQV